MRGGPGERLAFALVRLAGLLVPRSRRAEWRREWHGELDAWRASGRPLVGSALGAFPHATWIGWEVWTMRMEQFARDLRFGARALARRPLFTLAAVVTLALGLGAAVAVFSVVHAVLLRPLPFPDGERVVVLAELNEAGGPGTVSYRTVTDWAERSGSFTAVAAVRGWSVTLTGEADPEQVRAVRTTPEFFDVLGVRPALGRTWRADEDRTGAERVVVLGHGLWARRFGADPAIVGKPVTLTGLDYTVIGVMPADFEPLVSARYYGAAELWAPMRYAGTEAGECRNCRHLRAVARLAPTVGRAQAQVEMDGIQRTLDADFPAEYAGRGVQVLSLRDEIAGDVRLALQVLAAAVAFVLLIACANVASRVLARARGLRREVALRAALGAGRGALLGQRLAECLLLAGAAAVVGLLLAGWSTRLLVGLAPAGLPGVEQVGMNAPVLGFALVLATLTAVLFGTAPVLQAGRVGPGETLKEAGRGSAGRGTRRVRGALVVLDVAMALVLLAGVGLTLQSFMRVLRVDPGFDPTGVLKMEVSALGPAFQEEAEVLGFHREVLRRVGDLPGVAEAGLVSQVPLGGSFDRVGTRIEGRDDSDPARRPSPERYAVAGDYFRALRIPVLAGRTFTPADDENAPPVVLVNETFARQHWPDDSPLGARLQMGSEDSPWRTVVGVVGDVRHYRLEEPPDAQIYLPQAQWATSYMHLMVRTPGAPAELADAVRREIWSVDRSVPLPRVATLEEVVADTLAQRRFVLWLLSAFAGTALVLAMVGIYGLLAYHVAQRTQEIGIRVALGAGRPDVFRLILGQGMSLALVGVGLGLVGAVGLTRYLSSLLYGVEPTDPLTLGAVAALTAAVAFLACWVPARRATRLEVQRALGSE